jgi:hypothetical protein
MILTITNPGSLLPVILEAEVTDEQAEQVKALIERGSVATLTLRHLQVALGALNSLEDPFSDELALTNLISREVDERGAKPG